MPTKRPAARTSAKKAPAKAAKAPSKTSKKATTKVKRAQPESLRGRGLAISLTVRDLERSVDWYHRIVGFAVDQRFERDGALRSVRVIAGDVRVMLNLDDGAKGWDRVKGEGFSMTLTTVQDIDGIAAHMREMGGALDTEPADMPWGVRSFRVRDPDGYRWSISSPRPG